MKSIAENNYMAFFPLVVWGIHEENKSTKMVLAQ